MALTSRDRVVPAGERGAERVLERGAGGGRAGQQPLVGAEREEGPVLAGAGGGDGDGGVRRAGQRGAEHGGGGQRLRILGVEPEVEARAGGPLGEGHAVRAGSGQRVRERGEGAARGGGRLSHPAWLLPDRRTRAS